MGKCLGRRPSVSFNCPRSRQGRRKLSSLGLGSSASVELLGALWIQELYIYSSFRLTRSSLRESPPIRRSRRTLHVITVCTRVERGNVGGRRRRRRPLRAVPAAVQAAVPQVPGVWAGQGARLLLLPGVLQGAPACGGGQPGEAQGYLGVSVKEVARCLDAAPPSRDRLAAPPPARRHGRRRGRSTRACTRAGSSARGGGRTAPTACRTSSTRGTCAPAASGPRGRCAGRRGERALGGERGRGGEQLAQG